MEYPSLNEVEQADRVQLCKWYRFLPAPGFHASNYSHHIYEKIRKEEVTIKDRINQRFRELGGLTEDVSKSMGWIP